MNTPTRPSDRELALRALRASGPVTEEQFSAIVQADPQAVTRLAARGAELWADEETEKAARAYAESEAGRRAEAQRLMAQDAERKEKREEAKALVRQIGGPEDVNFLSDAELSSLTGINIPPVETPKPHSANRILRDPAPPSQEELAENLAALEAVSKGGDNA